MNAAKAAGIIAAGRVIDYQNTSGWARDAASNGDIF
jgi:hypothetical protein